MRRLFRTAVVAPFLLVVGTTALAAQATDLPEGVTQTMIDAGESLFTGPGICTACHGTDGSGVPGLGADLTDDEWLHGDGSYAAILETVRDGVSADASSTGTVMPPKGGSQLNDAQLEAVAAYVWSLSREGG
ncbi:MAG: c-type cytochrome [Gemmatimonadales bacterium]|jgi:cbb3-type cytochrome c oxidase subunit III